MLAQTSSKPEKGNEKLCCSKTKMFEGVGVWCEGEGSCERVQGNFKADINITIT